MEDCILVKINQEAFAACHAAAMKAKKRTALQHRRAGAVKRE
jgi:hypothetical protein